MRQAGVLDIEIGQRIRQARLAKAVTQDGLAQLLGISFQQVQKYESGSNRVSASRLLNVANALEVPVTYFYDELGQSEFLTEDCELPDSLLRTARILNAISDGEIKNQMMKLIRSIGQSGY